MPFLSLWFQTGRTYPGYPKQSLSWLKRETTILRRLSAVEVDYSKFKQLRNKVVSELHLAKRRFFSNLNPQNPKEFWKIIRSLSPRESSFPPLKSENVIASSALDKANLLNIIFTNHYNRSVPELSISNLPEVVPTAWLSWWHFMLWRWSLWGSVHFWYHQKQWWWWHLWTYAQRDCLEHHSCAHSAFQYLSEIPDEWKTAHVSPIPKSHHKSDPGSYCPISLLSVLSKLLEKHVRNLLVYHFEEFHPLST